MEVTFYSHWEDSRLRFAVIAAWCGGGWLFCRHRERETYELPGGHREQGESVEEAARREFLEETGAEALVLEPVCAYSVTGKNRVSPQGEETFGMLFYAEVNNLGAPPVDFEMAEVRVMPKLPDALTYPEIQSALLKKAEEWRKKR